VFKGGWVCLHIAGGVSSWCGEKHAILHLLFAMTYTKANIEAMLLYGSYNQIWIHPVTISPL
jgi:hypothetical protein